jgi:hypothetical protein
MGVVEISPLDLAIPGCTLRARKPASTYRPAWCARCGLCGGCTKGNLNLPFALLSILFVMAALVTMGVTAATSFAQTAPAGTVEAKDVKTWIITVDGKQYEARPETPTFSGTGGLFHLPSAYTVTKGKTAYVPTLSVVPAPPDGANSA